MLAVNQHSCFDILFLCCFGKIGGANKGFPAIDNQAFGMHHSPFFHVQTEC